MSRTIFRDANVLDGLTAIGRADVVVEGDRITEVCKPGESQPAEDGDVVHDLAGKTLMPGMVAGHAHLSFSKLNLATITDADMKYPATYMAVMAAKNARAVLEAGFTTAVGAGSVHNIDAVLKQLITEGAIIGPRIIPCGRDFVPTGHPVDYKPDHWNMPVGATGTLGAICDGPDEFRKEVRREAKRGNKIIKIYPEGGHGFSTRSVRMGYDEIATVVETAELCDMRVRAHAYSIPGIKNCLRAGVAIIDHGDHLDEELAALYVEKGTFVLPSLYLTKVLTGTYHTVEQRDEWFGYARTSLAMGVKAGVKFVTGDDFGLLELPHGQNARELQVYVEDIGIAPLEVIKWATSNGAALSQIADLGRIASGMLADIVVVDGDPLTDITVLSQPSKIDLVMKAGACVVSRLAGKASTLSAEL